MAIKKKPAITGNVLAGEVEITLGGERRRLVYDWGALAAIETQFNEHALRVAGRASRVDVLLPLVAIGLRRHHDDVDADALSHETVPVLEIAGMVSRAIICAYWGPAGPPADPEDDSPSEDPQPDAPSS